MGCGASTPAPLAASSPPPVAKPYVHGEAKPQEPADKAPAPEKPNVLPSTTREGEVYEWLRDVGMCEYTDSFLVRFCDSCAQDCLEHPFLTTSCAPAEKTRAAATRPNADIALHHVTLRPSSAGSGL